MAEIKLTLTALAKAKLNEYLSEEPTDTVVRILVEEDGKYGLSLDQREEGDVSFEGEAIPFVVEEEFAQVVDGLRIDYLDQGASSGFALTGGKRPRPSRKTVLRSEETPNPDAKKFVLAFSLGRTSRTWTRETRDEEDTPTPIRDLLDLAEVASVFLLNNFVTVTRVEGTDWAELEPRVTPILERLEPPQAASASTGGDAGDGSLLDRLTRFVDTDVAPFLQQDGGDIELLGVEAGVVRVRLVGACGTCPSSVMTLRMGVERRLMAAFPDEIVALELANPAVV